jgi:hypothetical protein
MLQHAQRYLQASSTFVFSRWREQWSPGMFTLCNVDSAPVGERLSSLMAAKFLFVPTAADAMARI